MSFNCYFKLLIKRFSINTVTFGFFIGLKLLKQQVFWKEKKVPICGFYASFCYRQKALEYVQYPKSMLVLTDKTTTSKSEIYFQNCVTKHSHSPKTGPKYAGRQASNFAIFFISKKKVRKIKKT
jgi:hypothetical protein